jgi:hypothetical protein
VPAPREKPPFNITPATKPAAKRPVPINERRTDAVSNEAIGPESRSFTLVNQRQLATDAVRLDQLFLEEVDQRMVNCAADVPGSPEEDPKQTGYRVTAGLLDRRKFAAG